MSGTILSTLYTKYILKTLLFWHLYNTWINYIICCINYTLIVYFNSYKCYGNKIDRVSWIRVGEIKLLPGMITKKVTFKGGKWTSRANNWDKQMWLPWVFKTRMSPKCLSFFLCFILPFFFPQKMKEIQMFVPGMYNKGNIWAFIYDF